MFFRKMELLDFEQTNPPIDMDDDDNCDNSVLSCEEDDEEDYDLCSSCDGNLFPRLVQPCGHMIFTNFVKKNNCQLCGFYKLALSGADKGHGEWVC